MFVNKTIALLAIHNRQRKLFCVIIVIGDQCSEIYTAAVMAPGIREKKGYLGLRPQKSFWPRPFCPKKRPILAQKLATYTRKSCQNERANMKESTQNDREIEYRTVT